MIQRAKKEVFGCVFEFGLLNEVSIAYCDTLERSLCPGRSVRSARSVWLLTDVEDAHQRATVVSSSQRQFSTSVELRSRKIVLKVS